MVACTSWNVTAQEAYLAKWAEEAVYQMAANGIPASITLAQGMLESGFGKSELATGANNHFGIKCHSDWAGESVRYDDDKRNECFRKYPDAAQSFEDHSVFLKKSRYDALFALKITNYKGWAKGLQKCGYATDPEYAQRLIELIERYDLEEFDEQGLLLMADRQAFQNAHEVHIKTPGSRDPKQPVDLIGTRPSQVSENNIRFILAEPGDDYDQLARELDMMPWQLYRYNEIERHNRKAGYRPETGEIIYLQPKRRRGLGEWTEVQAGETLWGVSQRCGVSMRSIIWKNRLKPDQQLTPGQQLSLRWRISPEGKLPGLVRTIRGPDKRK